MRKVYINYADSRFKKQQRFALAAAKHLGRFDEIVGFTRSNIDDLFYSRYRHILEQKRGGGYWLWKPYFIQRTLSRLSDGDYLFYSDADRKSTRLNSSHRCISYAVFCLKKK